MVEIRNKLNREIDKFVKIRGLTPDKRVPLLENQAHTDIFRQDTLKPNIQLKPE